MFRDRRTSYLTHVLYVLYALLILVGSPFIFSNPCWILHVVSNPCRIYFYVVILAGFIKFVEYAYLRRHAVDIFLAKNTL